MVTLALLKDQLKNVQQIQATRRGALAALRDDGRIVPWSSDGNGGDSIVQDHLRSMSHVLGPKP